MQDGENLWIDLEGPAYFLEVRKVKTCFQFLGSDCKDAKKKVNSMFR